MKIILELEEGDDRNEATALRNIFDLALRANGLNLIAAVGHFDAKLLAAIETAKKTEAMPK